MIVAYPNAIHYSMVAKYMMIFVMYITQGIDPIFYDGVGNFRV